MEQRMKNFKSLKVPVFGFLLLCSLATGAQNMEMKANMPAVDEQKTAEYIRLIKRMLVRDYPGMYREAGGQLSYPFLTPGSEAYADVLWDWDSWFSDVALRQILTMVGSEEEKEKALSYEQGCVLNYLLHAGEKDEGWVPICITREGSLKKGMFARPQDVYAENMHKPCLAQHAAFIVKQMGGEAGWLRESFSNLQKFINNYYCHHRHEPTGLYYWQTDFAIGVDNDPSTFFRPPKSSGSIYLNSMMYRELLAMVYLSKQLDLDETAVQYQKYAEDLRESIREHCWDERDGFYYSVDLNLLPVDPDQVLHQNMPRDWHCLIQRIGVWSGFMAMWAEVATQEQAEIMVRKHFYNTETFNAPYGIRTLSRMEKMYNLKASSNPSSWLGPIWGISNYIVFRGLVNYGYTEEARQMALKTIYLFGRDLERFGVLHEYYEPENGEPVLNPGFQNWNYLVLNMIAWMEGEELIKEF
jgi:putative isomerase